MKKFLLLVMFFGASNVFAQEALNEVYLDAVSPQTYSYKNFEQDIDKLNIKNNEDDNNEDYIYHPMKYIRSEASELYQEKKFSNKKEKNFGKTTVGTKYDTTLKTNDASQKRTLYTKYDLTDKMSVGADYQTNSFEGAESQMKGTVGVGPEYQINKKLKLKNKYSKNFGDSSNKGELSVEYKPFKDDRMDFNAGAAQIQQDDGTGSRSQVNFGTNIRF